jgi:hypothetical protein
MFILCTIVGIPTFCTRMMSLHTSVDSFSIPLHSRLLRESSRTVCIDWLIDDNLRTIIIRCLRRTVMDLLAGDLTSDDAAYAVGLDESRNRYTPYRLTGCWSAQHGETEGTVSWAGNESYCIRYAYIVGDVKFEWRLTEYFTDLHGCPLGDLAVVWRLSIRCSRRT